MSPFIGSIQWPEVETGPAGPGPVTTSSPVTPGSGHPPGASSDHLSLAGTVTLTPGVRDDSDTDGSGQESQDGAQQLGDEVTTILPWGPVYSTTIPPVLGGGQMIASVADSHTTPTPQEGPLHIPAISAVTGTADNGESDQLPPGISASTESVPSKFQYFVIFDYFDSTFPVGDHVDQTGRDVLIGVLASLGGAAVCAMGIGACCWVSRSRQAYVYAIQVFRGFILLIA